MLVPFDPSRFDSGERPQPNRLLAYLQQQPPELLAQIAQSVSPEVQQTISGNIQSLVGALPGAQFNVQVSTSRENLAGLLASAMMTGYFLRNVELRMELENQFGASGNEQH